MNKEWKITYYKGRNITHNVFMASGILDAILQFLESKEPLGSITKVEEL